MHLIHDIAQCPEGWHLTTVGEACDICDNLRLPLNVDQRRQMQGEFPYYGPTGILDYLNEYRIDGTYALIGEDGDHFLKFWDWPMTQLVCGRFNVNNHAHVVKGKRGCLTEWFHLYFHHMCLRPVLTLQGVGRYKLTRQGLERLPIVLPPVCEQKKLVMLIQKWTDAATILADLIAAKVRFKQGLMQQLLTGKRRFPGFSEKWKFKQIETFLTESRISGTDGAQAKKLTVKLYGKGVIPKSESRAGSESTKYFRRKAGQFIYSKLDFLNGAFGIIPDELDGYESTLDLPAFDFNESVDPDWFLSFVIREEFYSSHLGLANGGRKARRVNPTDLLSLSIPFPTKSEQRKIAMVMKTVSSEIHLLRKELEALKTQKKGLMQKLLTGQIRVPINAELV